MKEYLVKLNNKHITCVEAEDSDHALNEFKIYAEEHGLRQNHPSLYNDVVITQLCSCYARNPSECLCGAWDDVIDQDDWEY